LKKSDSPIKPETNQTMVKNYDHKDTPSSAKDEQIITKESHYNMDKRIKKVLLFDSIGIHYVSDLMPIDTKNNYAVHFEALSIGKVPSRGYFVINCFDEHRKQIMVQDCYVINKPAVTVTNISQNRKLLDISQDETDWGLQQLQHKYLAIYLDGDITKLPLLGTSKRIPLKKTDSLIELVKPLEENIPICGG